MMILSWAFFAIMFFVTCQSRAQLRRRDNIPAGKCSGAEKTCHHHAAKALGTHCTLSAFFGRSRFTHGSATSGHKAAQQAAEGKMPQTKSHPMLHTGRY
eukprot:scaffold234726_cov39-Tisochrysis_lutea.AAC.1